MREGVGFAGSWCWVGYHRDRARPKAWDQNVEGDKWRQFRIDKPAPDSRSRLAALRCIYLGTLHRRRGAADSGKLAGGSGLVLDV